MLERTTTLPLNEAYEELKKIALKKKCKLVEEDIPKSLIVEQGSVFGYSPETVEKRISFHFIPHGSGTRIVSDTSLTSSYLNSQIVEITSTFISTVLLWWLVSNIKAAITWFRQAQALIGILEFFVFALALFIFISIILVVYCYDKREIVAEKLLSQLPQHAMPSSQAKIYCRYCGAENPQDNIYCGKCGGKIGK